MEQEGLEIKTGTWTHEETALLMEVIDNIEQQNGKGAAYREENTSRIAMMYNMLTKEANQQGYHVRGKSDDQLHEVQNYSCSWGKKNSLVGIGRND